MRKTDHEDVFILQVGGLEYLYYGTMIGAERRANHIASINHAGWYVRRIDEDRRETYEERILNDFDAGDSMVNARTRRLRIV